MTRLVLPLFGLAVGAAIGWLVNRLPIGALAQSVAAALITSVLSSVGAAFIWARSAAEEMGTSAVTVNLMGGVIWLVLVGIGGAALHVMLGWLGQAVHSSLGGSRPVVVGSASGLMFGLVFAVAVSRIDTLT